MNKIVLKSLAIGLAIICSFSCDNNQEPNKIEFSTKQLQTQDSLFKEIMVIHDDIYIGKKKGYSGEKQSKR
jgi:hypothetical protein